MRVYEHAIEFAAILETATKHAEVPSQQGTRHTATVGHAGDPARWARGGTAAFGCA